MNSLASRPRVRFHAGSAVWLVLVVLAIVILACVGFWIFVGSQGPTQDQAPILASVVRAEYDHIVLDQGEVESVNAHEIRCEVKNRAGGNSPATTILEVVPEGTYVKPGDWLITFDSRALEQERRTQSIAVNTSKTLVIEAKAAYETALKSREEYLRGTYVQERKTILNAIFVAEEALKKAELSFDSIQRSVARGRLSALQLEGERFRMDAARNDLDLSRNKLEVLDDYTRSKMLTQLDSDIESAKVKLEGEEASHTEELAKYADIQQQIEACTVAAPQAGQVVYANVQSNRSSNEFVVEPGAAVRERQTIIRLPDATNMQVKAKINENRINLVKERQPVTIGIDAFGDVPLVGEVTKVNKYAEPGNWWSSNTKEYVCLIKIENPPPQIRSGLTAEVQIHVEHRPDALQIPVQAVLEREGHTFCLVADGDHYQTRHIVISSTNDKVVAVDEATSDPLRAGEQVVMDVRQHTDKLDFSGFAGLTAKKSAPTDQTRPATQEAAAQTPEQGSTQTSSDPTAVAARTGAGAEPGVQPVPSAGQLPAPPLSADRLSAVPLDPRRFDTNGDGKIAADELKLVESDTLRTQLAAADANGDGWLDATELADAVARSATSVGDGSATKPGGG